MLCLQKLYSHVIYKVFIIMSRVVSFSSLLIMCETTECNSIIIEVKLFNDYGGEL